MLAPPVRQPVRAIPRDGCLRETPCKVYSQRGGLSGYPCGRRSMWPSEESLRAMADDSSHTKAKLRLDVNQQVVSVTFPCDLTLITLISIIVFRPRLPIPGLSSPCSLLPRNI